MENSTAQFHKYIIKKIVNTVDYDSDTDEYVINRIHLSDDILNDICTEGARYGLNPSACSDIISQLSQSLVTRASANICPSQFNTTSITLGQHLRIEFTNPIKGPHYIEVVAIDPIAQRSLMVVDTNLPGLLVKDELYPISTMWNTGFYADFAIRRNKRVFPDEDTILKIGKIDRIIRYTPSVINEILDSTSDFSYDEPLPQSKPKIKKMYSWAPQSVEPNIFFLENYPTGQSDTATFVIEYTDYGNEAKLKINPSFKLPEKPTAKEYILRNLQKCCDCLNSLSPSATPTRIRTIKAGTLFKIYNTNGWTKWELRKKPQIKFIFE